MKRIMVTVIGLALVGSALTLNAQQRQGRGPGGPKGNGPGAGGPGAGVCALLDTDADGTLSAKEIVDAPTAVAKLDKNNDGQITRDEMCGAGQCKRGAANGKSCPGLGMGQGGQGRGGLIGRFDANGDGALSPEEAAKIPALLAELDKNGDTQLTADEFCPGAGQGRGCGRGNGRGCVRQ